MQAEYGISSAPFLSVLICTRNRPDDLIQALPGVLQQDYPDYEVIVVDQSTDDTSERLVRQQFDRDTRLRYIRTPTVGLSIARNLAIEAANADICAFTDDDCEVPATWLASIAATMTRFPDVEMLFSPVHVPSELLSRTDLRFPCLYFDQARVLRPGEIFGMGANMVLRKSLWQRIGPFDALLGPGAPLPGSDEHDWLYRAHCANAVIRLDPDNVILHRTWRSSDEWMRLTRTYACGDAAFAVKHLRCGDLRALKIIGKRLAYMTARGIKRVFKHGEWQYDFNYIRGYVKGLWVSWRFPVDHQARLFRSNVAPA